MNEIVTVNSTALYAKEVNDLRVVTFNDIDALHKRPKGTAKRNFEANRERFIENVDFYTMKPSKIKNGEIRTSGIDFASVNNRGTSFVTESGYLMIVKSLTDNMAWDVQRQLVNTYFNAKAVVSEAKAQNSAMENLLQILLVQQKEQRCAQETTNQQIFQMISQNQQTLTNLITSTIPQPYKPPFTRWMDKAFKKVDIIANTTGVERRQMLHKLYTELQDSYDIDLSEHTEEYCYRHGIQSNGKYTLNAIGADTELKKMFDLMVDTYIEQCCVEPVAV